MLPKPAPISQASDYAQDVSQARLNLGLRPLLLLALLVGLVAVFLLSLALGSISIPLDQILTVLLGGEAERASWTNIILRIRLPKATTAALAGAALGVSGLLMQTFFRNPLADPSVLGVNAGASLGVALVVLSVGTVGGALLAGFGLLGDLLLVAAAALGAALTMLLVLLVASRVQHSVTLLILGLMIGYLVSAAVSLLLYFAIPERIQAYISWTFGSFGGVTWEQMPILAAGVLLGLALSLALTKPLNALLLGEGYARSLGLNLMLVRMAIISATALLAGVVTAFCGPIAFLGIAVPHLCRSFFGTSDHRMLVPGAMLMGSTAAMLAALIAEVPGRNLILPLNAVTALMGAPVVIAIILHRRNAAQTLGS
ncbi:MAG: iron ABC transporter permease [Anaerolineae bacterium]|nr:iron ABC transporter permease [Anaerolineae bacterium]MDW8171192.1 iron ABC transporter permease [Anaerolineae bacterium]